VNIELAVVIVVFGSIILIRFCGLWRITRGGRWPRPRRSGSNRSRGLNGSGPVTAHRRRTLEELNRAE
jgi:hypothetical protein